MRYLISLPTHFRGMLIVLSCLVFTFSALSGKQLNFDVHLSPDAVDGVNLPDGVEPSGEAAISYNTTSRELNYHIIWTGLSGPPSAMHFHGPAPADGKAGVQLGVDVSANPATGSAVLTEQQDQDLRNGLWYLNLHTEANPTGEIRGQVSGREAIYERQFSLSYAQHVNAPKLGDSTPIGSGWISLDPTSNTLKYVILHEGLTGTPAAAHFHGPASHGSNAGVTLAIPDLESPMMGIEVIDTAKALSLLSGHWYVNIHTPDNPGGEVRGQVINSGPVHVFSVEVTTGQEVPSPSVGGFTPAGKLLAVYDATTMELKWWLSYAGLTGAVTGAHFHGPAAVGQSAGVQVGLSGTESGSTGQATLTQEQERQLFSGLWYINVHTATNPKGEIRGQLLPDLNDRIYVNPLETSQVTNPIELGDANPFGTAVVVMDPVTRETAWWVEWSGLTGNATNAHFHGPAQSGQQGGVVLALGDLESPATGRQVLTEEQASFLTSGLLYINVHTGINGPGELRGQVLHSPWTSAIAVGADWNWSPWFGFFYDANLPWVYHVDLGWVYSVSSNPEDINLYLGSAGWIWTSSYIYPAYYNWQSGQWGSF